jgi:hypothetical protein
LPENGAINVVQDFINIRNVYPATAIHQDRVEFLVMPKGMFENNLKKIKINRLNFI